jgi:hypothetical protein
MPNLADNILRSQSVAPAVNTEASISQKRWINA